MTNAARIAVVIPCFKVRKHIAGVLSRIGPEVHRIYLVDDHCPEQSGAFVMETSSDPRITVLFNQENLGVGGATLNGMIRAAADGADIIVKIDGDGQMNPEFVQQFANPILFAQSDYAKGNRFFDPDGVVDMPPVRLFGNAALSFLAKMSTGYWYTMDPTNGYFAIHASLVALLPTAKISKRYFFESDLLFRLNVLGANVVDVPMHAKYGEETSNLNPFKEMPIFGVAHLRNFLKRIFYNYFLRNFSIASLELVFGLALVVFGAAYGLTHYGVRVPATAGTVMIAALPIIVGGQLLLSFLNYDIRSVPSAPLHLRLRRIAIQPISLDRQVKAGDRAGS